VVFCAWEDLHWADPSTLEFLTLFLDQVPAARLLTVLTFRPEFLPPWRPRAHIAQLTLNRLGRQPVEAMMEKIAGGKPLPPGVAQEIVHKTDGVPLFVEELTKSVIESLGSIGSVESPSHTPLQFAIPTTLHDSLMARLDRLRPAKEIAQVGATIGREFTYGVLQVVSPLTADTLQQGLRQLVEAELLYQRGLPPQATYLFKHALIQDTAYQSLLKSKRQQLHQQIAQTLEERFPETTQTHPELLARHYTEAGLIAQAIPYWQQAGQQAVERSANAEAVGHLTKGLDLLKTLSDTPQRVQQELTLQLALGDALVTVKGYTDPEVEKSYTRARELCLHLGETPQLFSVLFRLAVFYINRQEFQTTHELAEQMMRLAQSAQDRYHLSLAHGALGYTLFWLGELPSARPHLEQAIALYDPQKYPRHTVGTADPRVNCFSHASWTLWYLGYPDQALKSSHEAVALAEGLSHPFSLAYALGLAAVLHLLRREEQLARERAEEVITLSTEQGFPSWLAVGTFVRDCALAEQGQVKEGIAQMRQSLPPYYLALLSKAYGKVGQVEEGLSVVVKALALVDKTGERVSEAELYRLKGELLLQKFQVSGSKFQIQESPKPEVRSPESEAEECFLRAIEIAQKQQAKSLELRASTSLARLWQPQGKGQEARLILAGVYNWFTEGFDTKDLQEAKALLEELSH
jgi:predicted ATPase